MASNGNQYARFTLRIAKQPSPAAGAPYQVTVLDSPVPKMGGATGIPMPVKEIQSLRDWAERAIHRAQQSPDTAERGGEAETVASKGQQLYNALPVEVRQAIPKSQEWANRRKRILYIGLDLDNNPITDGENFTLADLP